MCCGLPASGKSTWALKQLNSDTIIVDSDDIRKQIGGYRIKDEKVIQSEKYMRISNGLKSGKTVISADPNLLPEHELFLRAIAKRFNARFEVKVFNTPIEECILRDSKRDNPVGEQAIKYWDVRWKQSLMRDC